MISRVEFYIPVIKNNNKAVKTVRNNVNFTGLFDDYDYFFRRKPEPKKEYITPKDYVTPEKKKAPFVYRANEDELATMNAKFEGDKDALRYIYATKHYQGELPAHRMNCFQLDVMNEAFKDDLDTLVQIYLTPDDEDEVTPMHLLDVNSLEVVVENFQYEPEILEKLFTVKDLKGRTPAFYFDARSLKVMNKALRYNPELLKEIYLQRSIEGKTCVNLFNSYAVNEEKQAVREELFIDYANKFGENYLIQDENGNLEAHKKGSRYVEDLNEIFKNRRDILAKIHLTQNNKGQLVAHIGAIRREPYTLIAINDAFKDVLYVLDKIHATFDNDGKLPIQYANQHGIEIIESAFE